MILQNAIERNPDGWGMAAIRGDGQITTTKGFGFPSARKAWKKTRGLPRVFHARIGTSGTKDLNNCHPFDASTNTETRKFFHNGTISIPRLYESMCDSWHLAQYLRLWATGKELHNMIAGYANAQNSRFVLMTTNAIHRYGGPWIQRAGVFYSNAFSLGGEIADKSIEVTCDQKCSGLFWDSEKKTFTNQKDSPVSTPATHTPHKQGRWRPEDWQAWADDRELSENYRPLKVVPELRAPWFNLSWGLAGSMRSYPSINEFNYAQEDPHLQLCSTHRRKATDTGVWMETIFDHTGKWQSTSPVDGPYKNGLTLTSGDKFVYYDGVEMEMKDWEEIIRITFDLKDKEEPGTEQEAYERFMADDGGSLYEDEELAYEKGTITIETDEEGNEVVKVS